MATGQQHAVVPQDRVRPDVDVSRDGVEQRVHERHAGTEVDPGKGSVDVGQSVPSPLTKTQEGVKNQAEESICRQTQRALVHKWHSFLEPCGVSNHHDSHPSCPRPGRRCGTSINDRRNEPIGANAYQRTEGSFGSPWRTLNSWSESGVSAACSFPSWITMTCLQRSNVTRRCDATTSVTLPNNPSNDSRINRSERRSNELVGSSRMSSSGPPARARARHRRWRRPPILLRPSVRCGCRSRRSTT